MIEQIRQNCTECADCWLWQGGCNNNGHPKYRNKSLRRSVYIAAKGEVKGGRVISTTCGETRCVNPDHLVAKTKGSVISKVYATTDLRLRRAIASTRVARAKAKLSLEAAREIRASTETIYQAAERYGVHPSMVSHIRLGRAWKDANVWGGLGARG